jgi:hypothetical protein
MVLAQAAGAALDVTGRTAATVAAANLGGCLVLVATAYIVAWFKGQPWRRPASAAGPARARKTRPGDRDDTERLALTPAE